MKIESRWNAWIVALTYACMVGVMWGAYNPHTGLFYETAFPYMSETGSVLSGFFYSDPMRVHTNTFYHLSYLLGEICGMRGSYLPYQVVYALLWWARGVLVYAIVRKLMPGSLLLCFCAGAFAVTHASDLAMMFLGQMNQFGFIFWMLMAMYSFIRAWDAPHWRSVAAFALGTAFFEFMSLWSYESQIVLILAFPVLIVLARRKWREPVPLITWYSVPAAYLVAAYLRYTHSGGQSYQESVLRKTWSAAAIGRDWVFQIAFSLKFWDWENAGWRTSRAHAHHLGACVGLMFLAGWIAIVHSTGHGEQKNPFSSGGVRRIRALLAGGLVMVALSFPVYLLLDAGGAQWRTQMLSGPASGVAMAAALGLISCLPLGRFGRIAVALPAGAAIVYCGSVAAISKGGVHNWDWERHRTVMLEILRIAPRVQPDTVFVLTNVPKREDPMLDDMWFDMALRLAYPGVPVEGVFYYSDGTEGPGNDLVIQGSNWQWDGRGFVRLVPTTPLANTVAIEFDPSGKGKLLSSLPGFVCNSGCRGDAYRPGAAIIAGRPSPIAVRRFRVPQP